MLRERFPILSTRTYLASHSLGAVPAATREALDEYYREWASNGILAWDGAWWAALEEFSERIERLLGAAVGSVVPFQNATRGMAAVASCLDFSARRNKVVLTDLEFTTTYPFWRSQESHGARLVVVPSPDGISVPVERLVEALDDETILVLSSHVYFRSGAVQDLAAVARAAHRVGAYCLGDGYQAAGTLPVNLTELGLDFYVGGCHKWLCGGPGAGYFYCRPDLIGQLTPRLTGWFGLKSPFEYTPGTHAGSLHDGIYRFLDGTVNVPGLYAAREGLKVVEEVGLPAIRAASLALTDEIVHQAERRGFRVKTPRRHEERGGMVCLDFPDARAATDELVKLGIVVDWRPDCGMRVSPHFYNDDTDLARFFAALDALRQVRA
ncbi:MAG: aminotransferase class V-fold PLP-dependent enzyme [Candidatus Eremiobacterota bacterium]